VNHQSDFWISYFRANAKPTNVQPRHLQRELVTGAAVFAFGLTAGIGIWRPLKTIMPGFLRDRPLFKKASMAPQDHQRGSSPRWRG
jgi:hypothetical protein